MTTILRGVFFLALLAGTYWLLEKAHAHELSESRYHQNIEFVLLNTPDYLKDKIHTALAPFQDESWIDDTICRRVHQVLEGNGWVRRVKRVGKGSPGEIQIECIYRTPLAMVQSGGFLYLVDSEGIQLPDTYQYQPSWLLIQGIGQHAPGEGQRFEGEDLHAAITLASEISKQPYRHQITAILVHNYGGREDPYAPHVELVTIRNGSRIVWGSAPGQEVEENSVRQKLHLLWENYRRFGTIDARKQRIDISVFPDRFVVLQP